jgi:hypothetical protein
MIQNNTLSLNAKSTVSVEEMNPPFAMKILEAMVFKALVI